VFSDVAAPLSITSDGDETEVVVALAGELDAGGRDQVDRALILAEDRRPPRLVIDLRNVTFMDSAGITCVLRARARAGVSRRELRVLARRDRQPAMVFELCGLRSLVETTSAPDDADRPHA